MTMHQISPDNIKDIEIGQENLGEGTFGKCSKKIYRGQIVAVKYFKSYSQVADIEHESKMIMAFDHPGKNVYLYFYHTVYVFLPYIIQIHECLSEPSRARRDCWGIESLTAD